MSTISVRPVVSSVDLDRFARLPYYIYAEDNNWVAPLVHDLRATLTPGHSPFWQHARRELFIAVQGKETVGRIAAIVDDNYNRYNQHRRSSTAFFGWFESVNDQAVTRLLFEAVDRYAAANGCKRVLGPANPSLNDEAGLLVSPFDSPPMIKMSYNPPYYPALIESNGYRKAIDLYAYVIQIEQPVPAKLERVMNRLKRRSNLVVRPLDLRHLERDLQFIKEVYNDSWSANWDFSPLTDAEVKHLARQLRPVLVPELCPLVFCDGEAAGICIALPDYNQLLRPIKGRLWPLGFLKLLFGRKKINQCRLWALGIKRKFHNLGFDALLYYESFQAARRLGYRQGEVSWILETNSDIISPILMWGGRHYKTYRIYERVLASTG